MIQKFLFFVLIFIIFLLPTTDPDFGWQLRCGQEFLTKGEICAKNTFSFLLPNYKSAYPILAYPILLALFFERFGFWGLSILNALVITAAYAFLFHAVKNNTFQKTVFLLASIPLSWVVFSLGLRSQILSILFFSITLFIISKIRNGNFRFGFFLPFLFLLWANTHGGLVFGFLLILILIIEQLAKQRWRMSFQTTLLLLISSFLTSLINPFEFRIYQEVLIHLKTPLNTLIAEWVPPSILHSFFLMSILLLLFSSVLFSLVSHKKTPPLFSLLSVFLFIFFALKARRNLPFAYFSLIFWYFDSQFSFFRFIRKSPPAFLITALLIIGIIAASFINFPRTNRLNTNWSAFCEEAKVVYPCKAVEFLKKQKAGNIFNTYEWGGFLIWRLPEFKVFVDGRMPAWQHPSGKSPYTIFLETIQARSGWERTIQNYKINWLLISPGTFLDLELQKNPKNWINEVYRDKTAVIYSVLK